MMMMDVVMFQALFYSCSFVFKNKTRGKQLGDSYFEKEILIP